MNVSRVDLIQALESVSPGLSIKGVEQSDCYVFSKGKIFTYNGEIACQIKSPIKLTGALKFHSVSKLLPKIKDDELEIIQDQGKLIIKGNRKRLEVAFESEVKLPYAVVEQASDWIRLNDNFLEALNIVQQCAGDDEEKFLASCIHIHPKFMEATDNVQMIRYKINTNFSKPVLVKKSSLKHILSLDVQEFCETTNWIHFRNPEHLSYSCLKTNEEYLNLSPIIKTEVEKKIAIPRMLSEIVERAQISSDEKGKEDSVVSVKLKEGKIIIEGVGNTGRYVEWKKIKYSGDEINFLVTPKVFIELVKKYETVRINDRMMKVKTDDFCYICALSSGKETSEIKENE